MRLPRRRWRPASPASILALTRRSLRTQVRLMAPGLRGRGPATKNALLKAGGGNDISEAAVARGLVWLAHMQLKDGSWEFDGSSKDKIAATGMALLPFLAAGETHKFGMKYQKT